MSEWYCIIDDDQRGPISDQELRTLAETGRLAADDFVWSPEMSDWQEAQEVDWLAGIVAGTQTQAPAPNPGIPPYSAPFEPPVVYVSQQQPGKGLGIAGFVVSMCSVVLCICLPVVNVVIAVTGLVLSTIGLKKSQEQGASNGLALAGVILGIVGIVLGVGVLI
ncbi:MAG: GYF domain-containing protein, partial [Phycisphaerae bacterium]